MKTNNSNPTCPECGKTMARDKKPYIVQYKGLSSVVDLPGWYCTNCDEAVLVGKDMDIADRELIRLKAKAEHLLPPEQVRRIRKKLALTQDDAGRLLGGGPNAFHKYESAQVATSQAISNLLMILDAEPKLLKILEDKGAGTKALTRSLQKQNKEARTRLIR